MAAYRKVANSSLSWLVACFQIFRRLMKGKFDACDLWPKSSKKVGLLLVTLRYTNVLMAEVTQNLPLDYSQFAKILPKGCPKTQSCLRGCPEVAQWSIQTVLDIFEL